VFSQFFIENDGKISRDSKEAVRQAVPSENKMRDGHEERIVKLLSENVAKLRSPFSLRSRRGGRLIPTNALATPEGKRLHDERENLQAQLASLLRDKNLHKALGL